MYLQYLNDFRNFVISETNSVWLDGKLKPEEAEGNRAQINMLQEMVDLEFGDIADFYQQPDQEESDDNAG